MKRAVPIFTALVVLLLVTVLPALAQSAPMPGPQAFELTPPPPEEQISQMIYLPMVRRPSDCPAPTLTGPENGAALTNLLPTFTWNTNGAQNPVSTAITIATDAEMTEAPFPEITVNAPAASLPAPFTLEPQTTYYWRAVQTCGAKLSDPSAVHSFTTGPAGGDILTAPYLSSPDNNASVSGATVALDWLPVYGANGYVVSYFAVIGNDSEYATLYFYTTATELVIPLQAGYDYYWQVTAINDYAAGTLSELHNFSGQ